MFEILLSSVFTNHESILHLIHAYGSPAIFCLLALGILLLPIPDETLIVLGGILIAQKQLIFFPATLACYGGALCGISLSFFIGAYAGQYMVKKYFNLLRFTESKREQMHIWFRAYGKWVLFFGYFVPGIRHFAGLMAGISKLEFSQFALYAYSGAFLWTTTFLSIGYFLGDYGLELLEYLQNRIDFSTLIILLLVFFCIAIRSYLRRR
jgi:membrane protein DedA with SNARE-associated domain